jgi:hypothetical protein
MQRWAWKSRQILAFIIAITSPYSTDFLHRNQREICTEIKVVVQHRNRGSRTAFIESVQSYGSIQSAQKSRSVQYRSIHRTEFLGKLGLNFEVDWHGFQESYVLGKER